MLAAWPSLVACGGVCWLLVASMVAATTTGRATISRATTVAQSFIRQPSDQHVIIGKNVVLPCQVADGAGRVQWTRDEFGLGVLRDLPSYPRYQMIGEDDEGIFSLQIQRASLEDNAVFQCQVGAVRGQPGIRSRDARLTVLVPPDQPVIEYRSSLQAQFQQSSIINTVDGQLVHLRCLSHGAKPAAEVEWLSGAVDVIDAEHLNNATSHVLMQQDRLRSNTSSSLILRASSRMHGVQLLCRTHNAALSAPHTTAVTLHVQYRPHVHLSLDQQQLHESDDVTITCNAPANPREVRYRWYLSGKLLVGQQEGHMTMRALDRTLNGSVVRCEASNQLGTSEDSVRLNIFYAARFIRAVAHVSVVSGSDAVLDCSVDSNPPAIITWHHLDCHLCPTMVGSGSSLTLRQVSRDTAGQYECRVNSPGTGTHDGDDDDVLLRRRVQLRLLSLPLVTATLDQHARLGTEARVKCHVTGWPLADNVTWYHAGRAIDTTFGDYQVVNKVVEGGNGRVSVLVISRTTRSHFGMYNCSFSNRLGTGSSLVLLRYPDTLSALVVLSVLLGALLLCVLVVAGVVACRRNRATNTATTTAEKPQMSSSHVTATATLSAVKSDPASCVVDVTDSSVPDSCGSDVKHCTRDGSSPSSDWTGGRRNTDYSAAPPVLVMARTGSTRKLPPLYPPTSLPPLYPPTYQPAAPALYESMPVSECAPWYETGGDVFHASPTSPLHVTDMHGSVARGTCVDWHGDVARDGVTTRVTRLASSTNNTLKPGTLATHV